MSETVEVFRSEEMADLMDRVQQLLEASVTCMVLCEPNGKVSVACPPYRRAEVLELMRTVDWSTLR